jgi:hypothetical protein
MNQSRAIVTGLPADRRKPMKTVVVAKQSLASYRWIFAFVIIELTCQVALLFETFAVLRIFVRSAAYLSSILLLIVLPRGAKSHPSGTFALVAFAIIAVSIGHPTTNSLMGALATLLFALTVYGPIFWVPRIRIDLKTVRTLFLIYWSFNLLSAIFGALQIYYPGRFDPVVSTAWASNVADALYITLADGTRMRRPMGLTDNPGGAAIGAAFSIIFGLAFLIDRPKPLFTLVLLAGVGVASFTLYLCQVRSLLVLTLVSLIALGLPFIVQRRPGRYLMIAVPIIGIALVAFTVAVSVGGEMTARRWSTLTDNDVGTVYSTNRGMFLNYTLSDLVPQYPFGAGLGRWGMVCAYFGDAYQPGSPPLWAEIQWTGWLYDGGVPLMIASGGALVVAFLTAIRLAVRIDDVRGREVYKWAAVLMGYTVGMIALTFSGCPFSSTAGVDFWLLSAVVFAASQQLPTV